MFKRPEIGLKNFSEQIHNVSSGFIFNPLKALCFACFPAAFVSFQQSIKPQYL